MGYGQSRCVGSQQSAGLPSEYVQIVVLAEHNRRG